MSTTTSDTHILPSTRYKPTSPSLRTASTSTHGGGAAAARTNNMAPAIDFLQSHSVTAASPSSHLTIAAGVAIFHLASARVVLCYHTRDKFYFLPKGRRNANEHSSRGAEREGFEESGYRNRLLKLPLKHRQPHSDENSHSNTTEGGEEFVAEPVWTQFLQLSERTQYLLFWYIAETIPPDMEESYRKLGGNGIKGYRSPPPMIREQTIRERIEEDIHMGEDEEEMLYEPVRHEGTTINDGEENFYTASLVPVEEALQKLRGNLMEDVVRRGWESIQLRIRIEDQRAAARQAAVN